MEWLTGGSIWVETEMLSVGGWNLLAVVYIQYIYRKKSLLSPVCVEALLNIKRDFIFLNNVLHSIDIHVSLMLIYNLK